MPLRLTSPTVGFIPARPLAEDGQTTDPSVSVPTPATQRFAETAGSRAGTRSAGIAVERIRIASQSAATAPSAGGMAGTNVGPLTEIGLAQDHGAGLAQLRGDKSIARSGAIPASASDPAVVFMRSPVSMLSLMRTGMPCSGPRGPFDLRSWSSALGDLESVGVELDDGVEPRPGLVDLLNARQVFLGQGARRNTGRTGKPSGGRQS